MCNHQTYNYVIQAQFAEAKMKALLEEKANHDIHTIAAAMMFNKTPSDITPDERRQAKATNFGAIYGKSTKGDTVYIGIPDGTYVLECEIESVDPVNNRFNFEVINGLWTGYFDINQSIIRVDRTRETHPARVIHVGRVVGDDYNERISEVEHKEPMEVTLEASKPRPFRTKKG